jgi:hypothetical protein
VTAAERHELVFAPRLDEIGRVVSWATALSPSWVDAVSLDVGLTEAVTNAVVHGALEVSSSLRKEGVEVYLGEVERRSKAPLASERGVTLGLQVLARDLILELQWRGAPCPSDLRGRTTTFDPLAGAGMGSTLIYACFDEVYWGEDGYSLRLCLREKGHVSPEDAHQLT